MHFYSHGFSELKRKYELHAAQSIGFNRALYWDSHFRCFAARENENWAGISGRTRAKEMETRLYRIENVMCKNGIRLD